MNKILQTVLQKSQKLVTELQYQARLLKNNGNLPVLDANDNYIVDALVNEGVFVTSLEALSLPMTPLLLKAAEGLLPDIETALSVHSPGHTNSYNTYAIRACYNKIAKEYPDLFLWGLEERLLNIVENYIGLPVTCIGVDFRKEIPQENGRNLGTKLWHRDGEDCREVKILIYFNDVFDDSIVFEYIPRRSTPSELEIIYKSIYLFKTIHKSIYTDEEMKKFVPQSEWKPCPGTAGTVIFAATDGIFHHGKLPVGTGGRKDRFLIAYAYTSRQPENPDFCKRHFSREGLNLLESKLSERQREYVFWY
jgi:hypothetical protein